jgi:hypothetical protein
MGVTKLGARNKILNGIQEVRLRQGMGALAQDDDAELPGMADPLG